MLYITYILSNAAAVLYWHSILAFLAINFGFFAYTVVSKRAEEFATFWLFALVLLSMMNYADVRETDSVRFGYFRIVITVGTIVIVVWKRKLRLLPIVSRFPEFTLFCAWCAVSAPFGLTPALSLTYAAWLWISMGLLVVVQQAVGSDIDRLMRQLSLAFFAGFGLFVLPPFVAILLSPELMSSRVMAPLNLRQFPAFGAVVALNGLFYLWASKDRTFRIPVVPWAFTAMSALVVLSSLTRPAWFGFAIALLGIPFVRSSSTSRRSWLGRVTAALAILVSAYVLTRGMLPEITRQRLALTTTETRAFTRADWANTDERIWIWRDKIAYFVEHPVMGAGLAASVYANTRTDYSGSSLGAHSSFIGVLVETGIVGAGLFMLFLVRVGLNAMSSPWRGSTAFQYALLGALATSCISVFEYNLTPGQSLFWPSFAYLVALSGAPRTRRDSLRAEVVAPSVFDHDLTGVTA